MTENYQRSWHNIQNVYYSQPAVDTPDERSPNRAIEAIDHFSKPRTLIRYPNPQGYTNDGIPKKGDSEELEFWCFIRTIWAGKKEESYDDYREEGVVTYGKLAIYYNPYHRKHPPEGIHLHLSNPRNEQTEDYSGFSDHIQYNNLLWKVVEHNSYDTSYGQGLEYMGKGTLVRVKPSPINDVPYNTNNDSKSITYKLR